MKEYKSKISEFRLTKVDSDFKKVKITSSKDAYKYIKQFYKDDIDIYESFFLILLNRSGNTIGWVKISQGGRFGAIVDLAIIAKYAIDSLSSAVILAHNHPSGNPKPSNEDRKLTKEIQKGLALFKINVLDHIVLSKDKYFSFGDEGEI